MSLRSIYIFIYVYVSYIHICYVNTYIHPFIKFYLCHRIPLPLLSSKKNERHELFRHGSSFCTSHLWKQFSNSFFFYIRRKEECIISNKVIPYHYRKGELKYKYKRIKLINECKSWI